MEGRIQIRQTGSSSVYPFAIKIAQEFSKKTGHICPFLESTGTGSGFTDFYQSHTHNGFGYDIINASRRINPKELAKCKESGMASILEVCIGYDGIAFAAKEMMASQNIGNIQGGKLSFYTSGDPEDFAKKLLLLTGIKSMVKKITLGDFC